MRTPRGEVGEAGAAASEAVPREVAERAASQVRLGSGSWGECMVVSILSIGVLVEWCA